MMFEEFSKENRETLAPKKAFYVFLVVLAIEFLEFLFSAGFTAQPAKNAHYVQEFLNLSVFLKYFVVVAIISIVNAFIRKKSFGGFMKKTLFVISAYVLLAIAIHFAYPALAEFIKNNININIYNGQWLTMMIILSIQFAIFLTTESSWATISLLLTTSYDKEAFKKELEMAKTDGPISKDELKPLGLDEEGYENNAYIQKTKYLKMAKNPLKPIF